MKTSHDFHNRGNIFAFPVFLSFIVYTVLNKITFTNKKTAPAPTETVETNAPKDALVRSKNIVSSSVWPRKPKCLCGLFFNQKEMIIIPTAKKLPSGSWRCQVFSHKEFLTDSIGQPIIDPKTGKQKKKRVYKSFTCDDSSIRGKRKAEAMALEFFEMRNQQNLSSPDITFRFALERYIEERSQVLSPASIRKYRSMQRNCLLPLFDYKLCDITQDVLQSIINQAACRLSPKSIRDMNGLIIAVLNRFGLEIHFHSVLPKKVRNNLYIPTESDVKKLLLASVGTSMELPIMLAAFGAMRRGEICALSKKDFQKNTIHVSKTVVQSESGEWITKAPKSYAGDRYVTVPVFVANKFKDLPSDTLGLIPNDITKRFQKIIQKAGIDHFRFHDLRHYNASIQHALGIPDAYIMQSGGWGNDSVLKEVYRHALPDIQPQMEQKAISYFESMQHEMQHETKEMP